MAKTKHVEIGGPSAPKSDIDQVLESLKKAPNGGYSTKSVAHDTKLREAAIEAACRVLKQRGRIKERTTHVGSITMWEVTSG
jgi:hypothetical protein